jgi:hypothetical protein
VDGGEEEGVGRVEGCVGDHSIDVLEERLAKTERA